MTDFVVTGGGGHAKVIVSILNDIEDCNILGYTDIADKGDILGAGYLGNDDVLDAIIAKNKGCSAAIGFGILGLRDIVMRVAIAEKLSGSGYRLPAVISPHSIVCGDAAIGDGTLVVNGAIINTGVSIGKYAIINTGSSVDHDCTIGDSVHLAPGVTVGGGVNIGKHTFVGAGATIINGIRIGAECVIGAGAVVVGDCIDKGKYLGVPARLVE